MGKEYKAVEYIATKHHDTKENRYCIVSLETGEILDDAQGYGYKTAQKACAAYAYKTRDKSKDEEKAERKAHIRAWMKEHKSFVRAMNQYAFEIEVKGSWGIDDRFDADFVAQMLKECDLHPDFSAGELLRVWQKS